MRLDGELSVSSVTPNQRHRSTRIPRSAADVAAAVNGLRVAGVPASQPYPAGLPAAVSGGRLQQVGLLAEGVADGGAVLVVEVGGARLASRRLAADELTRYEYDERHRATKPRLDAVIEALTRAADEVNAL